MRIAIDLTSLADNFSGIERYAANMALAIIKQDRQNDYVLLFKDEVFPWFADMETLSNVTQMVVPRGTGGKLVFTQLILPHVLRKVKADLCLFLAFPCPVLYHGPSISTIHDLCCWDYPETMTAKSRLLWRVLDGKAVAGKKQIIAISEFSKSRIVEHYGIDPLRVHVAYCGIDETLFCPPASMSQIREVKRRYTLPDRFILSLSTLEPRKNLPLLIEAWCDLCKDDAFDYDLVLAGRKGWMMDDMLAGVDALLRSRIRFTDFVEDRDLPALYAASDLFVFPSLYEGFGLPPVEALCCGAKVLCSDIPSLREVCGNSAHYFGGGNAESLATAISRCLLVNKRGEAKSMCVFSWTAEANKLASLFSSEWF